MPIKLTSLGLVAFAVVDVLLVGLAFRSVKSPDLPATMGTTNTAPASSSPSPSRSATATTAPVDHGPVAFLSLLDDGTLLRASRGDCTTATTPSLSVSRDTGSRPRQRTAPGLRQVLAVHATPPARLTVVGLNDSCQVIRLASADQGRSWKPRKGGDHAWHAVPDAKSRRVHTPDGVRPAPCPHPTLSAVGASEARLLCRNGDLYGTADTGKKWTRLGTLPGAVDISYTSPLNGLAVGRQPDCGATVLRTDDGGTTWARVQCLPGDRPRAVAASGLLGAVQVGKALYVSSDGGATWLRSGASR